MELNSYIDATLLKADLTTEEVLTLCESAKEFNVAAVCVPGRFLKFVAEELKDTAIAPCTVIGFPLGNSSPEAKLEEAKIAIRDGARELDMVLQIGALKSKEYKLVEDEISKIVRLGVLVKVIIETALLSEEEIKLGVRSIEEAGAQYVKTSTGFSARGASVRDIEVIKSAIKSNTKIKASGGIRARDFVLELIKHGADRIGTSQPKQILKFEQ